MAYNLCEQCGSGFALYRDVEYRDELCADCAAQIACDGAPIERIES